MLIFKKVVFVFIVLFSLKGLPQQNDSSKVYSLSEITVTANRFINKVSDLSTKLEIVDSYKLINSNGFRLADKINLSPSVFLKSYGITPSLQTISMNGLGAEHTIILIDGVKINSFQNSQIDLSIIPISNIERIEILNSGASSIYGSEAISGVINVITKNSYPNDDDKIYLKGSIAYGSFQTKAYEFNIGKKFSSTYTELFYSKEKSDGNFEYYFDNGLESIKKQRQNSSYEINDVGINSQILFNNKSKLKVFSTYSNIFKNIPGMEVGTPPTKSNQRDRNWNNIISFSSAVNDNYLLSFGFNHQNNLMNYVLEPTIKSFYKNLVYTISPELIINHKLINGSLGYNFTLATLQSNQFDNQPKRNQHSVYGSFGIPIANVIKLYASSRYDFISDINKNVITYQLGLNIKPFENIGLGVKTNLGKNFRSPTFNDLYWKDAGNKNLRPENSINKELGLFYELKSLINFQIELTYTNISAKDKILWLPKDNFFWSPINIASSQSNNYLLSFSLYNDEIQNIHFKYDFGINWISSKKTSSNFIGDPTEGKFFPYLPLETIKSSLSLSYGVLSLNLFLNNYGKRFSDFENKKSLKAVNILDGNFLIKYNVLGFDTSFKFEINNITNTNYQIISGYPMPLRNFKLTLSINY